MNKFHLRLGINDFNIQKSITHFYLCSNQTKIILLFANICIIIFIYIVWFYYGAVRAHLYSRSYRISAYFFLLIIYWLFYIIFHFFLNFFCIILVYYWFGKYNTVFYFFLKVINNLDFIRISCPLIMESLQ